MAFPEKRRVLAIGDIHGCLAALEALVGTVPIRPDELVVALGDFVDRGSHRDSWLHFGGA